MCGIAGMIALDGEEIPDIQARLNAMKALLKHRGPDGEGVWSHPRGHVGFAHTRLAVIDLEDGLQPMGTESGNWLVYNGEVYNYRELRQELGAGLFRTASDTEVVLRAYEKWGDDCPDHFRGMFAYALWDEKRSTLHCCRDRFGIKPFYFTTVGNVLYFASECKALLPFVESIETDLDGFKDYLAFQLCLGGKTLFRGIRELPAAHTLGVRNGTTTLRKYWEVYYVPDFDHTPDYFRKQIASALEESISLHVRSDVPIGAYVSGGLDSSAIASLASRASQGEFLGFTGKYSARDGYDESAYARELAEYAGFPLLEHDISDEDLGSCIREVVYHLDYPTAGPGALSQYVVSGLAAQHRKVVLGGQGGDEVFGGYTRYLIAYFEQCIKAAIGGTAGDGRFVVTYESIIPNLVSLRGYEPLLQEFWRAGLFAEMDERYFRLINRTRTLEGEIRWSALNDYSPFESFKQVFGAENVGKQSYFDLMTHFDFKTLLPALLQVEDRVSMAHGLEARVPILDHPLVELAATIPADIKFEAGEMKRAFRTATRQWVPPSVYDRTDKMGFPTPFVAWAKGSGAEYVRDTLTSDRALARDLVDNRKVVDSLDREGSYDRKLWGLLCLEVWNQEYHDRAHEFRRYVDPSPPETVSVT